MITETKAVLTLFAAAILIAGCTTMTQEECARADWMDIGLRDGLDGRPMAMLDRRIDDCTKAGTLVDTGRYVTGRAQGLQTYCRLENAVPLGLSGADYLGVCPAVIDAEFRRRFQLGHAVYALREQLGNLEQRSESLEHQLRDADREEDRRLGDASTDDDRRKVRKEFDERRHRLRDALSDLDRQQRYTREALLQAEFLLRAG